MNLSSSKAALVAALALGATEVLAAAPSYCPASDVCFRWGVPEAVAQSGSGNLYFQLRAPANYSWIGLGTGSQMRGSDMFVMYADGRGNVTLSTRAGQGHVMPEDVERGNVQLLDGSGIHDGFMVANVRCSRCEKVKLTGSSAWIAAWAQGSPLNTTSQTAEIMQHDGFDELNVDLAKATVATDQNPFVGPQAAGTGDGGAITGEGPKKSPGLGFIHGIVMTIVFTIGYPLGAMLMPLVGSWLLHASWMTIIFLAMWAGFGIGVVISQRAGRFFGGPHTRLGVIVTALLGIQPILGWLHHKYFLKHHKRGIISYLHIWYGRALMILGIINGGLGIRLGKPSHGFFVAYIVLAVVIPVLYMASIPIGMMRKKRGRTGSDPSVRVRSSTTHTGDEKP